MTQVAEAVVHLEVVRQRWVIPEVVTVVGPEAGQTVQAEVQAQLQ